MRSYHPQLNKSRAHRLRSRRGTALGAAIVIALAMSLLLAGLLKWVDTESRISRRHVLNTKAKLAAEGVAEYGAAQIKARLEQLSYFPDDEFTEKGKSAPKLPGSELLQGPSGKGKGNGKGGSGGDAGGGLLGDLLGGLLGGSSGSSGSGSSGSGSSGSGSSSAGSGSSTPADNEYFRYEVTPQQIVVGRFGARRWEKIDAAKPFYDRDPLKGQSMWVREVRMAASATVTDRVTGVTTTAYCEEIIQVRDPSVFNSALFYNGDLEIHPGKPMEIYGPVHSNGTIYVGSSEGLDFSGIVTAAGQLFHARAPGITSSTLSSGSVTFMADGERRAMNVGGSWLDSNDAEWADKASQRWRGNVRTGAHGITKALPPGIPEYVPDNPATPEDELDNTAHVLVEPAATISSPAFHSNEVETQKFSSRATLVFEVSTSGSLKAYKYVSDASGSYVRIGENGLDRFVRREIAVPNDLFVGNQASARFTDMRRSVVVQTVDLDVSKLRTLIENSGNYGSWTKSGVTFDPATEWNGILYVDHKNTQAGGVRLVNGGTLPTMTRDGAQLPFVVATNAPLYVKGNYNADGTIPSNTADIQNPESGEVPAALAADAITILSNAWNDANSNSALSNRIAQPTEVSAGFVTGHVPSNKGGNGIYSGGVENLPRFLEDWRNKKFGYRGSMIVLFESTVATQPWGQSNVYSAPDRVWGYNKMFGDGHGLEMGPITRRYRRIRFRDLTADEYTAVIAELRANAN